MMLLSLGEFLWSLLALFFMVIYFMMLFYVIVDVFRRHDASGGKKALWLVFLLVAPLVGLLAYMITNSDGIAARNVNRRSSSRISSTTTSGPPQAVARLPRSRRPRTCSIPARSPRTSSTH